MVLSIMFIETGPLWAAPFPGHEWRGEAEQQYAWIPHALLPDDRCNMPSGFKLLLSRLPSHDSVYTCTVSGNKFILP